MENFKLSDRALDHLKVLLEKKKKEGSSSSLKLRISVLGGGCSGFQYVFTFDDLQTDDDHVFGNEGAVVIIDEISLDFLKGAELDYEEELIGATFVVKRNPQAVSSCGCGASFSAI